MGKKDALRSLPSFLEMPDGEELPFDNWSPAEKEKYQKRMMDELEIRLKYYYEELSGK